MASARPSLPSGTSLKDNKIRSTDFDALASKYSAFQQGYLQDPYLEMTVDNAKAHMGRYARDTFIKKMPVINRGTYVRCHAIDLMVETFLGINGPKQVISLGAGSDTRAFTVLETHEDVVYHELDFEDSCKRKIELIKKHEKIINVIELSEPFDQSTNSLHTKKYHLHPQDLRKLTPESELLQGIESNTPTLLISECCLCYMDPEVGSNVIEWITQNVSTDLSMVVYEPVTGSDSFGQIMFKNLTDRGVSKMSLRKLPDISSQVQRLVTCGFEQAFGASISFIHDNWLSPETLQRINRVEILDEREELNLLLGHYCIVWGSRPSSAAFAHFKHMVASHDA